MENLKIGNTDVMFDPDGELVLSNEKDERVGIIIRNAKAKKLIANGLKIEKQEISNRAKIKNVDFDTKDVRVSYTYGYLKLKYDNGYVTQQVTLPIQDINAQKLLSQALEIEKNNMKVKK